MIDKKLEVYTYVCNELLALVNSTFASILFRNGKSAWYQSEC